MKEAADGQLTEIEACERLSISRETMRKRRLAGLISRCKGVKAVRYWRSEIDRHGDDPEALSPVPAQASSPVARSPIAPAADDEWARCVAECIRRGIDPSDSLQVGAVMNSIYADDERAAAWAKVTGAASG